MRTALEGIKLFSGYAHKGLSDQIANHLVLQLGEVKTSQFADGETRVQIMDNLRNNDIYVIQPTCPPANDTLMELTIMIDALKRASAKSITAVIPYMGYLRQDKKVKPREPITAKLVVKFLEAAGVNRVMLVDPHFEQISGFFEIPVDILYGGPIFADYFLKSGPLDPTKNVVVAPDVSGTSRASFLAKKLGLDFIVIDKKRSDANKIDQVKVIGDVNGMRCIMIDDMADTCGTLIKDAEALLDGGATEILACVSHALLSKDAAQRIMNSPIEKFVCLNTLPIPEVKMTPKMVLLDSSKLISDAIYAHHTGESVSALFEGYR